MIRAMIRRLFGNAVTRDPDTVQIVGGTVLYPKLGTSELLLKYNQSPWLRSVVGKIAKAVSVTNWKLYVVKDEQGRPIMDGLFAHAPFTVRRLAVTKAQSDYLKGELDEIRDHPQLDMLRKGNDFLSGQECLYLTQVYMDLVGEAFWFLLFDAFETPYQYLPVHPSHVTAIPHPGQKDPHFRVRLPGKTADETFPPSRIVMFREPDPSDPYGRGSGMGRTLGDEIEIDEYGTKHIKQFFTDGAWPDLLIGIENASQEELKRLELAWKDRFQGVFNRFKAAFVNRKLNVEKITHTFKDMQIVDMRKFTRDLVIQYFGVPPEKFGQLTACYTEDTEVLTSAGWKFWSEVTPSDELASYDVNAGRIVFARPNELFVYDHDGPVHVWRSEHGEFAVTPNHRMVVTSDDTGIAFVESSIAAAYGAIDIKTAADLNGTAVPDLLSGKDARSYDGNVVVFCGDEEEADDVQAGLLKYGWSARVDKSHGHGPIVHATRCDHEYATVDMIFHYRGKVYCADTGYGNVVVRRNGRAGVCGNSNRSTISMADFFWTKDIILPRVDFIRAVLQNKLVPMFDDKLVLDFESPVVQDKEHVLNVMRAEPGAFTINEWRKQADHQSLGDAGEKFIIRPGEQIVTNVEGDGAEEEEREPELDGALAERIARAIREEIVA